MAKTLERVKVSDIKPLVDEYGNEFVSRDYSLQVNQDYVARLAESFGPGGEPEEYVKLVRDGDCYRIKAGNSRVRAMQLLGTEECWAVIDDEDTVKSVVETVVKTNVKKKYEPVEESRFVQQLAMFGDDEYVGEVACIGTEKAAKVRRARELAGGRAEQMSLEHLCAVYDFDGYPEWAEEVAEADEEKWRTVASRLKRAKDEREAILAFESEAKKLKIEIVEERPDGLQYIMECVEPDDLAADYMAASVDYMSIVGRIGSNWSGAYVDLYGEPIADDEAAKAKEEAERRRLIDRCEAQAAAVDAAVREWFDDQFLDSGHNEIPSTFNVLASHCYKVAMEQYWVHHTVTSFKGVDVDECLFLFLAGYLAGRKTLEVNIRCLADDEPSESYRAEGARTALKWIELHEQDGWEPDEGMAEFLADARAKLAPKGGE